MISVLIAFISLFNACVLVGMLYFLRRFKASMPDIQEVLTDVGESISGQLTEIFEKKPVKAAFTNLANKSHEARASNALKDKVAGKVMGQNILLKKALEYLDISPLEGLELLNDPMVGPVVRNLMAGFAKGSQGFLGGLGGGNSGGGIPQRGKVPLMS